jgi:hypothetical protein
MEDNPCTSTDADQCTEVVEQKKIKKTCGGKNCCVPQCLNNSLRNPELSFYSIPKDEKLKRKWHKVLKTKGLLEIKHYYRVCSAHFPDGKKKNINNGPTILTNCGSNQPRERVLRKPDSPLPDEPHNTSFEDIFECSNRTPKDNMATENTNISSLTDELITSNFSQHVNITSEHDMLTENAELKEQVKQLESKCTSLEKDLETYKTSSQQYLFRMERFIGSDSDFRFYTGFPDYATFNIFFDYLSPACTSLIYYGSNTGEITTAKQKKCGKKRSTSPEQELFMVLARLRCGFLQQDLAHRFGISCMHACIPNLDYLADIS